MATFSARHWNNDSELNDLIKEANYACASGWESDPRCQDRALIAEALEAEQEWIGAMDRSDADDADGEREHYVALLKRISD